MLQCILHLVHLQIPDLMQKNIYYTIKSHTFNKMRGIPHELLIQIVFNSQHHAHHVCQRNHLVITSHSPQKGCVWLCFLYECVYSYVCAVLFQAERDNSGNIFWPKNMFAFTIVCLFPMCFHIPEVMNTNLLARANTHTNAIRYICMETFHFN